MRPGFGQAQERVPLRSAGEAMAPPAAMPATKEIPYDYVARFILRGERGKRVQDVINISIEGAFVAVAIGYSFIPEVTSIESGGGSLPLRPTIDFKYSIVDSGSGRELQNQPIHNIAGLGEATGERPFRPMAKPMVFMPRSTIRIEIEEISSGSPYKGAELQIVLQGYKILGYGTAMP